MRKILTNTTAILLSATLAGCGAPEEAATDATEVTEDSAPVEETTDAVPQRADTDLALEEDEADGDRGNPIDDVLAN